MSGPPRYNPPSPLFESDVQLERSPSSPGAGMPFPIRGRGALMPPVNISEPALPMAAVLAATDFGGDQGLNI